MKMLGKWSPPESPEESSRGKNLFFLELYTDALLHNLNFSSGSKEPDPGETPHFWPAFTLNRLELTSVYFSTTNVQMLVQRPLTYLVFYWQYKVVNYFPSISPKGPISLRGHSIQGITLQPSAVAPSISHLLSNNLFKRSGSSIFTLYQILSLCVIPPTDNVNKMTHSHKILRKRETFYCSKQLNVHQKHCKRKKHATGQHKLITKNRENISGTRWKKLSSRSGCR